MCGASPPTPSDLICFRRAGVPSVIHWVGAYPFFESSVARGTSSGCQAARHQSANRADALAGPVAIFAGRHELLPGASGHHGRDEAAREGKSIQTRAQVRCRRCQASPLCAAAGRKHGRGSQGPRRRFELRAVEATSDLNIFAIRVDGMSCKVRGTCPCRRAMPRRPIGICRVVRRKTSFLGVRAADQERRDAPEDRAGRVADPVAGRLPGYAGQV